MNRKKRQTIFGKFVIFFDLSGEAVVLSCAVNFLNFMIQFVINNRRLFKKEAPRKPVRFCGGPCLNGGFPDY
jgi:hypothetical protein